MSEQLIAKATSTEAQILTFSAYDSSGNPSGVKNGEIYFATDTKKIFLAIVNGSDIRWRVVESASVAADTSASDVLSTNPTLWIDANAPYSVGDATEGDRVKVLKDLSGNDFHYAQSLASKQFTLSRFDGAVNYFDPGHLAGHLCVYRCADQILGELGMRIGSSLSFSSGATSCLVVFKLNDPFAKGTGNDHSGGTFPNDTHNKNYEDCVSFAEKSNCTSDVLKAWGAFPFLSLAQFMINYKHTTGSAKFGGVFLSSMFTSFAGYMHPKAGIFDNCFDRWNTMFIRTSGAGNAFEVLLNGKNWLALCRPMLEGAGKTGAQLGWVSAAPAAGLSTATNDKWEVNTETEVKTSFYTKIATNYHHLPYVEPGYEYYPMDGLDGGASGTANANQASTGVYTNDGRLTGVNRPEQCLWNPTTYGFNGNNRQAIVTASSSIALDLTGNHTDIRGGLRTDWSELLAWKRRLSDEDRNKVLNEVHAKYQGMGSSMPNLPGSTAVGNSGGMMPTKASVYDAPWI